MFDLEAGSWIGCVLKCNKKIVAPIKKKWICILKLSSKCIDSLSSMDSVT